MSYNSVWVQTVLICSPSINKSLLWLRFFVLGTNLFFNRESLLTVVHPKSGILSSNPYWSIIWIFKGCSSFRTLSVPCAVSWTRGHSPVPEALPAAQLHWGLRVPAEKDTHRAGAPHAHSPPRAPGTPGRLRRLWGAHRQSCQRYLV